LSNKSFDVLTRYCFCDVISWYRALHQPLHTADNHDRGGNEVKVWSGSKALALHHLWDTEFVRALARKPAVLSQVLLMQITSAQAAS
jgi:hypothetical protein